MMKKDQAVLPWAVSLPTRYLFNGMKATAALAAMKPLSINRSGTT